jgi:hypothetical protein
MKCYYYETNSEYIFCVEDVENIQLEKCIESKGWRKVEDKFHMAYPQHMFINNHDKELIGSNFIHLGQAMFESGLSDFDWEKPLELITEKFNKAGLEWYLVGSAGDAVRGVNIKPGDIDIVVHTRDYHKAKDICFSNFPESILSPYTDN